MRRAHRRLGIRGFLLQEVIPLLLGVGSLALYLSVWKMLSSLPVVSVRLIPNKPTGKLQSTKLADSLPVSVAAPLPASTCASGAPA